MFIGMTEAGDAGRDFSWYRKVLDNSYYKGAILITKFAQEPVFQQLAKALNNRKPVIIHVGVTGWGATPMEPGNKPAETVLQSIRQFVDDGFPAERLVLRIDPIIPTAAGIERALDVLALRRQYIPDVARVRISIYDDYHKSREEMVRRGYAPVDNITKWKSELERRPTPEQVARVARALTDAAPGQLFECCAEPELAAYQPDHFVWTGCLSQTDCGLMGIEVPAGTGINGQNRYGCRCLQLKKELLSKKCRCPNNCAYCYWGRN